MGTTTLESDLLDQVANCLTSESAERLAALQLDDRFRARLDYLADKCNFSELTSQEDVEHTELVQLWQVITLLQLRTKKALLAEQSAG